MGWLGNITISWSCSVFKNYFSKIYRLNEAAKIWITEFTAASNLPWVNFTWLLIYKRSWGLQKFHTFWEVSVQMLLSRSLSLMASHGLRWWPSPRSKPQDIGENFQTSCKCLVCLSCLVEVFTVISSMKTFSGQINLQERICHSCPLKDLLLPECNIKMYGFFVGQLSTCWCHSLGSLVKSF